MTENVVGELTVAGPIGGQLPHSAEMIGQSMAEANQKVGIVLVGLSMTKANRSPSARIQLATTPRRQRCALRAGLTDDSGDFGPEQWPIIRASQLADQCHASVLGDPVDVALPLVVAHQGEHITFLQPQELPTTCSPTLAQLRTVAVRQDPASAPKLWVKMKEVSPRLPN